MPCTSVRPVSKNWSVCTTTATLHPWRTGGTLIMIGTTTARCGTPTWSATVTTLIWTGGGTTIVPPWGSPRPTAPPTNGPTTRVARRTIGHATTPTTAETSHSVSTSYGIGSPLSASIALVGCEFSRFSDSDKSIDTHCFPPVSQLGVQ